VRVGATPAPRLTSDFGFRCLSNVDPTPVTSNVERQTMLE